MNERIKELEQQCWSHRVDGVLVDGQLHFDIPKFAELIVQECAELASEETSLPYDSYSEKIKRHFGVEE
jgi:hypothetical protein